MIRFFSNVVASIFVVVLTASPAFANPSLGTVNPGALLSDELVQTISATEANALRDRFGLKGSIPDAMFAVKLHALRYQTSDENGAPTIASGMLIVPLSLNNHEMPLLSLQHGTSLRRSDSPSNPKYIETVLALFVYSAQGFVTAMPDYLGMGISQERHPYLHAKTEASAARDMLIASRQFCEQHNVPLSDELYISGYSQGGHATMALHQLLQAERVNVTASFPMAGPFDLSHTTMKETMKHPTVSSPGYAGYLMTTMKRLYGSMTHYEDAFVPEVAAKLEDLFDGTHSSGYVLQNLPSSPAAMFLPDYLDQIINANEANATVRALEANDNYDWIPQSPVYFFQASGDHDVPFQNSKLTYELFKSRGVQTQLTDLGATQSHVSASGGAYVLSFRTMIAIHNEQDKKRQHGVSGRGGSDLISADVLEGFLKDYQSTRKPRIEQKSQNPFMSLQNLTGLGYVPLL